MYQCISCKRDLPRSSFSTNMAQSDGRNPACVDCAPRKNIRAALVTTRSARKIKAEMPKSKPENLSRFLAMHPESAVYNLWYKYGLSVDSYMAMYDAQSGLCAVCDQDKRLIVEHEHESLRIRGLVCYSCNTAISYVEANPEQFSRIAKYLAQSDA